MRLREAKAGWRKEEKKTIRLTLHLTAMAMDLGYPGESECEAQCQIICLKPNL